MIPCSVALIFNCMRIAHKTVGWSAVTLSVLACLAGTASASAQSADALIDKLVQKGILTVKEANELREESDKGFNQAYQVKSGMPDWVSSFKISGDFRGRYEGIFAGGGTYVDSESAYQSVSRIDQSRWRYRLRFGAVANFYEKLEVGFRLGSGDIDNAAGTSSGIDPISQNQTFQNNGSKKGIFIDLAYAKWTPLNNATWWSSMTFGKMENPFVFSDMVFDKDYTPEGAAFQFAYNPSSKHSFKMNVGGFAIDELKSESDDPYLGGVQLRVDSTWNKRISTSFGVSGLGILNPTNLVTAAVPNSNQGNSRNATNAVGILSSDFNPIIVDGAITYSLESFPFYPGAFPITLAGEYMNNPGAANQDYGYNLGITFGKSGKKGTWDVSYRWKYLGANAWYEEMVDSDFGGWYVTAPNSLPTSPNSGIGGWKSGYVAGTNVKGHVIKANYSPYDSMTLSVTVFLTELILPSPAGSPSDVTRLQVDATLKF
jgi:hypothetical protein